MRRLHLSDLSPIQHEYYLAHESGFQTCDVLLVKYSGSYRQGTDGNADAALMYAVASAGLAAWRPAGLVLDLSELAYERGNAIESLFALRHRASMAVVVGPACRAGLYSLLRGIDGTGTSTLPRWVFEGVDPAIRSVSTGRGG